MSISNVPKERNWTASKPTKIMYPREYLLSLSELEICKRLPKGIDESFLSQFRSSPEQGFSPKYSSPLTTHNRVLLLPGQGSAMSISSVPEERSSTPSKPSKLAYAREYLLSLCELEICKRLPEGVDETFLSEYRSSSEEGSRRNEYSSSAPGKGETGNVSREFQRRDNRSSWRSDSNPQSDRESDCGRRYDNKFKRSGQNQEHDGLLGSGSITRPPGYGPHGSSAPTSSANDQCQLNRSNDPYHPPRPYKAPPNSWRETKDSLNDETFGSAEDTDEDRVEEERKRRAEFEMMRKEQQKELQEKMKSKTMNKLKVDPLTELTASVEAGENAVVTIGLDTTLVKPIQEHKVSVSSQGHPFRPLMPPGFANAATKNMYGTKSFDNPLEMRKPETEDYNQGNKAALKPRLDDKHPEKEFLWDSKSGNKVNSSSASHLSSKVDDHLSLDPSINLGLQEILANYEVRGIVSENDSERKFVGKSGHSASILGRLFEGASNTQKVGSSNIIEDDNMKADIYPSPKDNHSSKFAQWFLEEERKPVESGSSNKPNALFSLIAGEKSGSVTSDSLIPKKILTPESNLIKMGTPAPCNVGVSGPVYSNKKPEYKSAVLTCEDLEQSFISDFGGCSSSISQPPGMFCSQQLRLENEIPLSDISNSASQHLLSLLQKGITSSNSTTVSHNDNLVKGLPRDSLDVVSERTNQRDENPEKLTSGKGLTLETLFGASFMNELQSSDASVSVKGNSAESSICVSQPHMQSVAASAYGPAVTEARSQIAGKNENFLGFGRAHQIFDLCDHEEVHYQRPVGGRQEKESSPFLNMLKPEMHYQSMHPQFHRSNSTMKKNHGRPVFSPPDAPHLEGIDHQDAAIYHRNSVNLGHADSGSGLSQFDHPILQQIRMPNILPHHPLHSAAGYPPSRVQDQHHLPPHAFPYAHPVDLRLSQQGGQLENNPPQTFQSLLEMELRSNPKPRHPSIPAFGHPLDSGFWYR